MIFSLADHIEQIKAGTKTQTRRPSDKYKVGSLYAVQPGRGQHGIPEGKILIRAKIVEEKHSNPMWYRVLPDAAKAEGGYTPEEYEALYEKMYPGWTTRWAYLFCWYPTEVIDLVERGELDAACSLLATINGAVNLRGGRYEDLEPGLQQILQSPRRVASNKRTEGKK